MLKLYTRLFDELLDDVFTTAPATQNAWIKTDTDVPVIYLELPGVKKEDVEISIDRGYLNVKAKRTWPTETTFDRTYSVSRDIDIEKIECKLELGVLELKLPKKEEAKPKLIEIK